MQTTPNYNLQQPQANDTVDLVDLIANNTNIIDAQMKANAQAAAAAQTTAAGITPETIGAFDIGKNNKSTQQLYAIPVPIDTRTVTVNRTNGQVSGMTVTDPTDNSVVETVTVNRNASGQISSLVSAVAGRAITYTVNRDPTSGQITSVTKAVN